MLKEQAETKTTVLELAALDYSANNQDVKLTAGTPLMARVKDKGFDICNNEMFMIKKINKTKGTITVQAEGGDRKLEIANKDIQRLFNVAWCITCHKSQGSTYDHPYTIHEFGKMDDRMKYVAISRSTKIEHICLW